MARSAHRWVLLSRPPWWLVSRINHDRLEIAGEVAAGTPQDVAAQVAAVLAKHRYGGEGLVLAVDSMSCLVNRAPLADARLQRQRQALAYAFEENLPTAVEELTVDFCFGEGQALGVAIPNERFTPLLSCLQDRGVQVQAIVPVALLASQQIVHRQIGQHEAGLLIWEDEQHVELLTLESGRISAWNTLRQSGSALRQHLRQLRHATGKSPRGWGYVRNLELRNVLHDECGGLVNIRDPVPGIVETAVQGADAVLRGQLPPWVDLRRETLAASDPYRPVRGLVNLATAAVLLLLLAASGVLWFRAWGYRQTANQYQKMQEDVFREALPGQRLPRGILRVLQSEQVKASGLRGQGGDLPTHTNLLVVLRATLSALPQGTRFRVNEFRFERDRVVLDGEVRTHADADAMAAGFRRQGFEVAAPRSQQLPDAGVSLQLTARYQPPPPSQPANERPDSGTQPTRPPVTGLEKDSQKHGALVFTTTDVPSEMGSAVVVRRAPRAVPATTPDPILLAPGARR